MGELFEGRELAWGGYVANGANEIPGKSQEKSRRMSGSLWLP